MRNFEHAIVSDWLKKDLRQLTFKKQNLVWNRWRRASIITCDVISFQKSSFSSQDEVDFTINVGVFVAEFEKMIWPHSKLPKFVSDARCIVSVRLPKVVDGVFEAEAPDSWWTYSINAPDTFGLADEVRRAIMDPALPFLGNFETAQDLHGFLFKSGFHKRRDPLARLYIALVFWKIGNTSSAVSELEAVLEGNVGAWKSKVESVLLQVKRAKV